MQLGEKIRAVRYTILRMSQSDLAKQSGISAHHLRMIEAGKSFPSKEVLERILDAMGAQIELVIKS